MMIGRPESDTQFSSWAKLGVVRMSTIVLELFEHSLLGRNLSERVERDWRLCWWL